MPHVVRSIAATRAARPVEVPWLDQGHPTWRACPGCGLDCSAVPLVEVVVTFEFCSCLRCADVHLVEQLCHRACLIRGSPPRPP